MLSSHISLVFSPWNVLHLIPLLGRRLLIFSAPSLWGVLACPHPVPSDSALNAAAEEGEGCVHCAATADWAKGWDT